MLPMMGMLFYGKTKGSIACAIMFTILVFFLWIPYGRSLLQYDYTETTLSITVSIGIYEGQLLNHKDIDDYINRADEAMYQAKESGRNRIVYYNEMKTV